AKSAAGTLADGAQRDPPLSTHWHRLWPLQLHDPRRALSRPATIPTLSTAPPIVSGAVLNGRGAAAGPLPYPAVYRVPRDLAEYSRDHRARAEAAGGGCQRHHGPGRQCPSHQRVDAPPTGYHRLVDPWPRLHAPILLTPAAEELSARAS